MRSTPAGGAGRSPSGIGRSAFFREIAVRVREDASRVVVVGARSSGRPYGAVAAVVEQLAGENLRALEALPRRSRAVLDQLAGSAPAPSAGQAAVTRHQVVAALQRVFRATGPTMVCVRANAGFQSSPITNAAERDTLAHPTIVLTLID